MVFVQLHALVADDSITFYQEDAANLAAVDLKVLDFVRELVASETDDQIDVQDAEGSVDNFQEDVMLQAMKVEETESAEDGKEDDLTTAQAAEEVIIDVC